ncbi:MAG TPA: hypothetical protein DIW20_00670 [Rhodospirillaceae bacterium]|nr:hypothetical protein [Rhodospirillaceae bacterium]
MCLLFLLPRVVVVLNMPQTCLRFQHIWRFLAPVFLFRALPVYSQNEFKRPTKVKYHKAA